MLNGVMDDSKFAPQLSTCEGFEIKVSEALHASKPLIASRSRSSTGRAAAGASSCAQHMFELCANDELLETMSVFAPTHVSDEVSFVGNSAAWMYVAVMSVSRGVKLQPKGAWLNALMLE